MAEHKHIILYAEDDPDDLFIVRQAFDRYGDSIHFMHCPDGQQALECLEDLHSQGVQPCLIILDMNMPGMNGRDTLIYLRQSEQYRSLPVVIFTTSSSTLDREFARKWEADFITKPATYEDLEKLARNFVDRCTPES